MKSIVPSVVNTLSDAISALPGIGPKGGAKIAMYLAANADDNARELGSHILRLTESVSTCPLCNNIMDAGVDLCTLCEDQERDSSSLMVVETVTDLLQVEHSGEFNGYYYVTGGLVSPVAGIDPEKLGLKKLANIFKRRSINEVVIALSATVEGEATSLHIIENYVPASCKITQLARGLPAGSGIEYLDKATLKRAIDHRSEIN